MGQNERGRIQMTGDEIDGFLERSRTATIATVGVNGAPHLVAMWYAIIDGDLWIETTVRAVCEQVYERYFGPYGADLKPVIDEMMKKRVAVRLRGARVRSWDHRKLGMPAMPVGGSTAQYL